MPRRPNPGHIREGVRSYTRRALLTGLALTVPILVTVIVLVFAVGFLLNVLDPLIVVLRRTLGLAAPLPRLALQVVAVVTLVSLIFLVGAVAESRYASGRVERRVERVFSSIPGLGSIYESLNEMSRILLSRDTDSFKEVKLVEYPGPGSYTIAFLTAEPSEPVLDATRHDEMVTLFMPMAPNPFMGGFVIHVSADRVYDVDMTVEEGVQAIVSSGIAVDETLDEGGDTGDPAPARDRRDRDGDRGYGTEGDHDRFRSDGGRTGEFHLREHTADVAVEAEAATLGDVMATVADGMAAAMAAERPPDGATGTVTVTVRAEDREALLFDYLDSLIYERDVREVLPVDNTATVARVDDGWRLTGEFRGIPLSAVRARDLKAVTYSEMDLSEQADGWHAYVVFDV